MEWLRDWVYRVISPFLTQIKNRLANIRIDEDGKFYNAENVATKIVGSRVYRDKQKYPVVPTAFTKYLYNGSKYDTLRIRLGIPFENIDVSGEISISGLYSSPIKFAYHGYIYKTITNWYNPQLIRLSHLDDKHEITAKFIAGDDGYPYIIITGAALGKDPRYSTVTVSIQAGLQGKRLTDAQLLNISAVYIDENNLPATSVAITTRDVKSLDNSPGGTSLVKVDEIIEEYTHIQQVYVPKSAESSTFSYKEELKNDDTFYLKVMLYSGSDGAPEQHIRIKTSTKKYFLNGSNGAFIRITFNFANKTYSIYAGVKEATYVGHVIKRISEPSSPTIVVDTAGMNPNDTFKYDGTKMVKNDAPAGAFELIKSGTVNNGVNTSFIGAPTWGQLKTKYKRLYFEATHITNGFTYVLTKDFNPDRLVNKTNIPMRDGSYYMEISIVDIGGGSITVSLPNNISNAKLWIYGELR